MRFHCSFICSFLLLLYFSSFLPGKLPAKVDKNCNSSWHFAHRKYNNNKLQLQTVLWQKKVIHFSGSGNEAN